MAENNAESPIKAPEPPKPESLGNPVAHASTLKLKPVIRKPGSGPVAAPAPAKAAAPAPSASAAPEPMAALKSITQNLKSVTAPIPQQAILHKTGIISDPNLTEAQTQAAKARTSRISLNDAMGAAPVKNDAAPMKTIRIKRPVDTPAAAPAGSAAPAAPAADATTTQRKTLKITRPSAAKSGLKKPGAPAAAPAAEGEVADIPDLPPTSAAPAAPVPNARSDREKDVPKGLAVFDFLLQLAACAAIGFLAYLLYVDFQPYSGDPALTPHERPVAAE